MLLIKVLGLLALLCAVCVVFLVITTGWSFKVPPDGMQRGGQAPRHVCCAHDGCACPLHLHGNARWLHRDGISRLSAREGLGTAIGHEYQTTDAPFWPSTSALIGLMCCRCVGIGLPFLPYTCPP
jgi:hypothetical protein